MLKDSGAKFCITEENISEFLANENTSNLNLELLSDNLCYCIYTSGSTGKPKGTIIRHKNLINFSNNNNKNYQAALVNIGNKIISMFKSCFDAFAVDSVMFLLNGKSFVLASEQQITNSEDIVELTKKFNVDVLHTTPSIFAMLFGNKNFEQILFNYKVIIVAAESFPKELYKRIIKHSNTLLLNGYGPSETTIGVTFGLLNRKIIKGEINEY